MSNEDHPLAKQNQIEIDLEQKTLLLGTIGKFGTKLQSITDTTELLCYVACEVVGQLDCDNCAIYLVNSEKDKLRLLAAFGPKNPHHDRIVNALEIPIGQGIISNVAQSMRPIIVDARSIDDRDIPDIEPVLSEICIPLIIDEKLFGVINCEDARPQYFGQEHLFALTTIATVTGVKLQMLEDARLAKQSAAELRRANEQLLNTVAKHKVVEEKFRQSERRFQDFANSASDWYWEQDEKLRFTKVDTWRSNYRLAKFFQNAIGHTRWELLGVNLDNNKHWKQHVEGLLARRSFRDFRYEADEDGKTLTFSVSGTPFFTGDGEFKGYRGTATEITELVDSQRANTRFISALDHLSEGLLLWDSDEKLVVCNARMRELSGIPAEIMVPGLTFESLITERVRLGQAPELEKSGDGWKAKLFEDFRNPTGPKEVLRKNRWYLRNFIKLSDGGTMQVVTDITDFKMGEKRFELSTEAGGVGVWESSLDDSPSIWSDSFYALFGLAPGAVSPTAENFLKMVHPDDQKAVEDILENTRKTGQYPGYECRVQHISGSYIWVVSEGKLMNFEGGRRWLGTCKNINRQKHADKIKSEFLSTMSHELRTPLTAICGSVDLLLAGVYGEASPKASQMLSICRSNADRLLLLVDDLLELEKLEAGKLTYNLVPLSSEAMLSEAREANEPFSKKFNITIAIIPDGKPFSVLADKNRTQQVFSNLISNAVKFSPNGSVIEISARQDGDFGVFSVKDHGPGITKEFAPKLFARFTQEDSSDTRSGWHRIGPHNIEINCRRSGRYHRL